MEKKTTILYVDDEPTNLILFEANFENKYNIITAESGDEGLDKLEHNPLVEVVISDMKMPGMTGVEFIERAKECYPNVSYYILTGFSINDQIQKALDSNLIQRYFGKPFNVSEIDREIQRALGKKQEG